MPPFNVGVYIIIKITDISACHAYRQIGLIRLAGENSWKVLPQDANNNHTQEVRR